MAVARRRHHERVAAGIGAVASSQSQVARGGPVRVKVLIAAGKARQAAVGHKDAACQLGKLGTQAIQALVKVVEQIAQEQVEVYARELLTHHGRRRAVAHRATERRRVAVVDKALLKPNTNLREHVAHAVGIGVRQQCARPHLARQARQRIDLLGQGAGAHQQVGAHAVHVRLGHDLGRKAQKAQLAGKQVIELLDRVLARGQLLEQAAEQRHIGQVLKRDAAQVEILHGVGQAVGGDAVAQAGDGSSGVHDQRRLGARLANVGHTQARQRGLGLGCVFRLLRGTQYGRALDHIGQLGIGHGIALGCQLGGLGTLRTLGSVYRNQLDQRHVVVFQHELAQQVLKVAAVQLVTKLLVHRAVLECQRRGVVIVEPGAQRVARNGHAVGDTVVALAQIVLVAADDSFQALARNALLAQVAAGVLEHATQLARHAGLRVLQHDELVGLQALGRGVAHHVAAQAGGQNGLLNWCLVGTQQRLEQDVRRNRALAVERTAQHQAQANQGVFGRGGHLDALIIAGHRRLHVQRIGRQRGRVLAGGNGRVHAAARGARLRQIALVQKGQRAVHVQVAVERDVGVGRIVVARVRVQELLVGERGNCTRVATALVRIGGVGIERGVDGVVQHAHGVGQRALHLVEHHAVVAQRALAQIFGTRLKIYLGGLAALALRQVQLVVPALLLKNGGLGIDGRVEHRVQVHVHQVVQVLLVGGGNGVDGLVGVGHGVEERLHGALDQIDKRLLDGELGRSAQHRVLKDVEHAGGIGRRRLKANGKGLVLVVARQVQQTSARGSVSQHVSVRVELGHGLAALDGKAVAGSAGHQQCSGCGARVG